MSIRRLPPLNAVRAFEAAAQLGSYVAASRALHVTQPAIGRHVKLLEEWLGVQLFDRTSRGVELTAAGRQYHARISAALAQIADAGDELARQGTVRWLKIIAVPAFAKRWLSPKLEAVSRMRPGLKIVIEPNSSFTEVDGKSADLGIVYGMPGDYRGARAMLMQPRVFPVCSPDYLDRRGPIGRVEDLARHDLIHYDSEWWNLWFGTVGVDMQVSADVLYVSNDHVLALAEDGRGIALANEVLVREALEEGRLVRALEVEVPLESYQLLAPPGPLSADVEWFLEWISATLREEFP
ncbi:LysR substrate-binding domain-containing protein [Metapseudomonas resinovorans]|uniref:Putative LysR family transcriptional regulator n=1 Tax=Metapseudomonas resinovorans NBRC 106553 TaxID=1245471 RepID=S6AEJ1_METRE|nr:LysR substrate-binding domain-containing protein [Pseudomonas resinovorans]BAN48097.1 putative LysR family transcriptional regulator [Pseudomonas resinovorans NBRC 106553]